MSKHLLDMKNEAGLLTFLIENCLPTHWQWPKNISSLDRITAAGTVLDFHQIPFSCDEATIISAKVVDLSEFAFRLLFLSSLYLEIIHKKLLKQSLKQEFGTK